MKFYLPVILLLVSLQSQAKSFKVPVDSIGIKEESGKIFILHKVEAKETLYSLSRRYNIAIFKIIESNPPSEFGLDIGQIIKIPFVKEKDVAKRKPGKGEKVHVVEPKETIFSLSRMYDVSIVDIRRWNNLEGDLLDIGQQLIIKLPATNLKKENSDLKGAKRYVVKSGETLYSISRKFDITISDLKEWNNMETNEISIGQELIVGKLKEETVLAGVSITNEPKLIKPPVHIPEQDKASEENLVKHVDKTATSVPEVHAPVEEIDKIDASSRFEEVTEAGIAELIEGSDNTRKYLALHRSAAIGTILRVRNEMNDQEVFVRVLGKLPDTGLNKNILIKISKPAYERLGAIDPKFRVSISYIP